VQKTEHLIVHGDNYNPLLAFDDAYLAAWFGLGLAEIAIDHFVQPVEYFLAPITTARAVVILRRGAENYLEHDGRVIKLYEALTFLEERLKPRGWLAKRYRNELRWDCRNIREKQQKRERLRVMARGVQLACIDLIVEEMNELGRDFRKNKAGIDKLRRMLEIVRRPVPGAETGRAAVALKRARA
jgi:hypothetical protein